MWNTEVHRRPPGMCLCLIEFSPSVHFKEEASINSSLVVLFDSNIGQENPFTSFRFSEQWHGAHIFYFGQDIICYPHRLLNTFIGYCSNGPLLPNANIAKNVPLDWNLMCPTARYPKNKWPAQFHWVFCLYIFVCIWMCREVWSQVKFVVLVTIVRWPYVLMKQ